MATTKFMHNCNGCEYVFVLDTDRPRLRVSRIFPEGIRCTDEWAVKGEGDLLQVLTHYGVNDADNVCRRFWAEAERSEPGLTDEQERVLDDLVNKAFEEV